MDDNEGGEGNKTTPIKEKAGDRRRNEGGKRRRKGRRD